jgi:signal transduction histidine kinase/CheY-like chemotaxis protein/HPt (histidine-containing phosphotransfer) domain-containing protein
MLQLNAAPVSQDSLLARSNALYIAQEEIVWARTDRLFAGLMAFQWLACIVTALWISPRTWIGTYSNVHIHIWAAILLGGAIAVFPIFLAIYNPGKTLTRHVMAVSQMLMSALLIHLSGGRIETHFHVFGSLAFLAFYRDWRVLLTASLVVALDHGLRGLFWPQSVYGVLVVEPWRWLEHTGWVVFEDIFLIISIHQSLKATREVAHRQSKLERMNEIVEAKVAERTAELESEINERKQTEVELEATNSRLQILSKDLERSRDQAVQASRFKSEFLANMSHEIRTPLNAVVGMSDLLTRTPLSDEQREYGMIINSSADVLLTIINDILDFSKIESGRLDLEIIDFDLVELVEGAAELVADRARNKQLSLSTFIDPSIPLTVRGDPGRIRQILLNFLSNSIKFTDRGEIVVSAVPGADSSDGKLSLHFSVSDTGIGLNQEARKRLFQPFTQADSSITRKYGGTGLGLAISKRLVELMGGQLTFDSTYGEGTVFGFKVDLERCSQQERQPHKDLHQTRILLVDGPEGTQQVLNAYISSWGMRCTTATDVDKATRMLRHEAAANDPYDMVFVAFEPGDLEPLSLLREVRQYPQLTKTKLVVIGTSADREFGQQAMANGFSAYLPLPVRQSRLFDCIANLLQQAPDPLHTPGLSTSETLERKMALEPEPRNLILVVEDNAANQKVALLQLRELGLGAHAVGNGLEALEAVARTQYALILMDCQMPDMDGFEATKQIRKMEARTGKHTPVIAMTAHAMAHDRLQCLTAGMDDYVSKPVSQKKLAEVINRWLPSGCATSTQSADAENGEPTGVASQQKPMELEVLYATYGKEVGDDLLRHFLISVDQLVQRLPIAFEKQDTTLLEQLGHELKGVSATFYASELAELGLRLEEIVHSGKTSWKLIETQIKFIDSAWKRMKIFLRDQSVTKRSGT